MNDHYLALYRKYRPQTFEDVCGRDAIIQTLRNQITSGRIGHSYLFCGTRGTGKTTIAKIFARAVNCEHPVNGSPCGECECCKATLRDANLNVVEMDAASNNGVDSVRDVIEQVTYPPTQGRYRVFIVDEVHMLSTAASNALLKTLEEPPSYAIFILATTEPNKLLPTILSRCQRYDFGRLPIATIAERLRVVCDREGLEAEDKALQYIASAADGSMRDGLSLLDQCNAFNYGNAVLTYDKTLEILGAVDVTVFSDLFRAVHACRVQDALGLLDDLLAQGRELVQFTTDFLRYLRNVMLLKASEDVAPSLDVSADHLQRMLEDARSAELSEILRYIRVFSELTEQIRYSGSRRILTEAAIIRLCEPSMDITTNTDERWTAALERIRVLEDKIFELETRPSVTVAPARAETVENVAANPTTVEKPTVKPTLPVALSEDLRDIASKWDALVGGIPTDYRFMKLSLRGARPTAADDETLLLVFENTVTYGYFADGRDAEEHRSFLEQYLASRTGHQVQIRYKQLDNGQQFSDNYVDLRSIRAAVNMEIEEES